MLPLHKRLRKVELLEKRGHSIAYNIGTKEAKAWLLSKGASFVTLAAERRRLKRLMAMSAEERCAAIAAKRQQYEDEKREFGIEWDYLKRQIAELEAIVR